MRKINEMLQRIPLDELNGGDTMDNRRTENDIEYRKTDSKEIRLRRGTGGLIAAALVLAVGGGVLAFALSGSKTVAPAAKTAESVQSADPAVRSEADKKAEAVFRLINSNISRLIEDGILKEISPGAFTLELSESRNFTESVLVRNDPENDGVPENGTLFYCISSRYKLELVQWLSPENETGQFPLAGCERTPFGVLPDGLKNEIVPESAAVQTADGNEHAETAYNVINRMLNDYAWGDRTEKQMSAMLPPGDGVLLDFDHPDCYADFIYRIKQYCNDGEELTGRVYFEYALGNDLFFLEWQSAEGEPVELFPHKDGAAVERFGEAPADGYDRYTGFDDSKTGNLMGCEKTLFTDSNGSGGYFSGVITDRGQLPKAGEWYESFLAAGCEPVPFDESRLLKPEEIKQSVSFEWLDFERHEKVFIRTSDMEGADIYVNGRYYNVQDNSVLSLLDDGMPLSIDELATDKAGAKKLLDSRIKHS